MKKEKTPPKWLQKARESWGNTGTKRPPFAIKPEKGQRSVWDFPRPPIIEKLDKPVLVKHAGKLIATTRKTLTVLETASPPTYYLPKNDIHMELLILMPQKTSLCEWKGAALYWALKTMPDRPVAWSYPKPFQEFAALQDHLAFYPQHLECYVDGQAATAQDSEFYAGWITPDLTGPFKGERGTEHW